MAKRDSNRVDKTRLHGKQRPARTAVHVEIVSISDRLRCARNTAATVALALPGDLTRANQWEVANTLYEGVVRILDSQLERLTALAAKEQP